MIPIARPLLGEEEAAAARNAILSGWVTQGPRVREFEERFAETVGAPHACAVSSCTTALHLALRAVGVGPGDVVITVSHSFIATANAVRHSGAEPLFVDIDPRTYNMRADDLESLLRTECTDRNGRWFYRNVLSLSRGESPLAALPPDKIGRISAVLPVHQMGLPCDLHAIVTVARRYGIPVVEDAACAVGSEVLWQGSWEKVGRPHGDVACFSFHPRKVITTGDGGMLTTANPDYDRFFRLMRQHAMSSSDTQRHASPTVVVEEYLTTGYNFRLTDIQASVGIEQLKRLPSMLHERRRLARRYREELAGIPWISLGEEPDGVRTNWQSLPVRLSGDAPLGRDAFMQYLLDNGIATRPGIMNAHQEAPYSNHTSALPRSLEARANVVLLPIFAGLTDQDVTHICTTIRAAHPRDRLQTTP